MIFPRAHFDELMLIDKNEFQSELDGQLEFLSGYGDRVPIELLEAHQQINAKLKG